MEIKNDYGSGNAPNNVSGDAAVERQGQGERASNSEKLSERLNGEQLSGRIVDIARGETPPVVTVKLSSGELLKGSVELPVPTANAGDSVKFTVASSDGRIVLQNMEIAEPESGQKLTMMKSALEVAGLKVNGDNLRLVSLLLENELPINKESLAALSRATKLAGMESAEKAVLLMKNDIQPTQSALENLNSYTNGGKLVSMIESLAQSIMELPDGAEKQKLLQIFTGTFGETGEPRGTQAPASNAAAAQDGEAAGQANTSTANAQPTAQTEQTVPTGQPQQTTQADTAGQPAPQQIETETGTKFFRDVFDSKQNALEHMRQHPPSLATEKFIDENIDALKNGLANLSAKGEVTKENVGSLLRDIAGGEGKLPFSSENDAEMKSFILRLAEKTGLLDENVEKAEHFRNVLHKGAKKIAERLSVLLDDKKFAENLDKTFENIKERLALVAKGLGNSSADAEVKRGVEDIKENMKFLSSLKNNQFLEFPVVFQGQQKHAELYVFSRKGGKVKSGGSQSALLSLDLASLGHFETYVQKTGNSVTCQFRTANDETEELVRENIDKLGIALKSKKFSLDSVSFKKTDEKYTITDEEPAFDGREDTKNTKSGRFSIDYKA